ncbi:MAG TPA: NAD-dependent epimerase/dehydratase family protein [Thermoplasmata archaeon]|nr:NAD-dependent epimerase/dehydratase family protein [Thermoplasmata archaeon]
MSNARDEGPVVVTGGAGAVGSVLVRRLLAEGREVRVIDNLSSGKRSHLPPVDGARLSLTVADIKAPEHYAERLDGATAVWHLAANTDIRRGSENPRLDLEEGTVATAILLDEARRHDVPAIRFSSSSVVYGWPTVFPTPEDYGPLEPQSLYAAAKLAAEGLLSAHAHSYGITAHIFRFTNVIGPGMTHGVLHDFFEKLERDPKRLEVLGDGRQSKSYLRTEDCVDGMLLGARRAHDRVNVFNLGTPDRISVREIAEKVVAAHGGRARIEYTGGERGWAGDVPQQLLAIDRIRQLGWTPRHSSAEAIDRTIREMVEARLARSGRA